MEKKNGKEEKNNYIQIKIDKKKFLMGFLIILVVAGIIGLSFITSESYGDGKISFDFTEVSIDDYLELMKSTDKKIVYVARPTCSYCQMETPIMKRIGSKYDLTIYYLNTDDFFDQAIADYTEDGKKFINSNQFYIDEGGFGTPNTLIVQDSKVVDAIYQYTEESELVDLFKRNGFINE